MPKYTLTTVFGSEATEQDVLEWQKMLADALPDGAEFLLVREPFAIAVDELDDTVYGRNIRFRTGPRDVEGTLDAVYRTADTKLVVVVDGTAYPIHGYEVATITDW